MMMLHSNDDNTVLRPLFADFTQILSDYWTIICDLSICEHVCVCFKEFFYELREERKYFHFQIFKVFIQNIQRHYEIEGKISTAHCIHTWNANS